MRSFLARLVVAAAVLTGSFWGTGAFLDYLDHPGRSAANRGPVVFAMSVDPESLNWQAATSDTTIAVLAHQIAIESRATLISGGWLLTEVGAGQAALVAELASVLGFGWVEVRPDLAGIERVVAARR